MDLQSIKNFEREQSLVLGKASSQLIYCTVYFNMEFPDRTEAFIISDENDFMFDVELDESDYESVTEKIVAECQPDDEA